MRASALRRACARRPYNAVSAADLAFFRAALGPSGVLTAADDVAPFATDWLGQWGGPCPAVLRPADAPGGKV